MDEILKKGADSLGYPLDNRQLNRFSEYCALLTQKNKEFNLTAVSGEDEIVRRHFLDSLMLFKAADLSGAKIIDVGTGAGFPGVPLKIYENSIELTLLDSQEKRVAFLRELCAKLELQAECLHGRAEELSKKSGRRDCYDYAVSRALARLNVLCELCLPFVRPGGAFLAMKASGADAELKEAENAVKILGGSIETVFDYEVGGLSRIIVVIRKLAHTPEGYPRRFARLQKQPL
jgi:16S rRNA (guanine527-N7)-methyltransferase